MLSLFVLQAKAVNLCWRTNKTLPECTIPFEKEISQESDLVDYFGYDIVLELRSTEEEPALIEKFGYGLQNLTVIGYNSYLLLNLSKIDSFNELKLSNVHFAFIDEDPETQLTFNYLEFHSCDVVGSGIQLHVDNLITDLESVSTFQKINVFESLKIDSKDLNELKTDSEVVFNVDENAEGDCTIENIPYGAIISSDESSIHLSLDSKLTISNVGKWNVEFLGGKDALIRLQEPSAEMADKMSVTLTSNAAINVEDTEKTNATTFMEVVCKGQNTITLGVNAKVDVLINDNGNVSINDDNIEIGTLTIDEGRLIFENEAFGSTTKASIDHIIIKNRGQITSQSTMMLKAGTISIDSLEQEEYAIDRAIEITGFPDFVFRNTNCKIGMMQASASQNFNFIIDFKHNDGVLIDKITKHASSFEISLSIADDAMPDDDLIQGLIGKDIKLLKMPLSFCMKNGFDVLSDIDGFTPDTSVIEQFCHQEDVFSVLGFKFTNTPKKANVHACIKDAEDCPNDDFIHILDSIDQLAPFITEDTKHLRLFIPEEQTINFNFLNKKINVTIQGCKYYDSVVHIQCTNSMNENIQKLKFEHSVADFMKTESSVVAVDTLTFTSSTDMTEDSKSEVTFNTRVVEIAFNIFGHDSFSDIKDATILLDDDTLIAYNENSWAISDSEASQEIDSSRNITLCIKPGNQISIENTAENPRSLDVYGSNVAFYVNSINGIQRPILYSHVNGVVEITCGDYIPISFANSDVNIIVSNNAPTVLCPQNLKNGDIFLYKKSQQSVTIKELNITGKGKFIGDPFVTEKEQFVTIETLDVMPESDSEIENCIIKGTVNIPVTATLTLDKSYLDKATIEGKFSLGEKKPSIFNLPSFKSKPMHIKYAFDESLNSYCASKNADFLVKEEVVLSPEDVSDVFSFEEFVSPANFSVSVSTKKSQNGIEVTVNATKKADKDPSGQGGDNNKPSSSGSIVAIVVIVIIIVAAIVVLVLVLRSKKFTSFKDVDAALLITDDTDEITKMV